MSDLKVSFEEFLKMGEDYEAGLINGVPNKQKAIECYRESASLGSETAFKKWSDLTGRIYDTPINTSYEKAQDFYLKARSIEFNKPDDVKKFAKLYEKSASLGHITAMFRLGLSMCGEGNAKANKELFEEGVQKMRDAANLGEVQAVYQLSNTEGLSVKEKLSWKIKSAYEKLTFSCDEWDLAQAKAISKNSLISLHQMFKAGGDDEVVDEADKVKSFYWLSRYIALGDNYAYARILLADCYLFGFGVEKDNKKAFSLLSEWVEKTETAPQLAFALGRLAECYIFGYGTNVDVDKGLGYLYRSIESYPTDEYKKLYELFNETPAEDIVKMGLQADEEKNEVLGNKYYVIASLRGDSNAMRNVAINYKNGTGVREDINEAFRWFKQSADAGNSKAQNDVGCAYLTGDGVDRNEREAFNWYKRSAENGYNVAMFNVANIFKERSTEFEDQVSAVFWMTRAFECGYDGAEEKLYSQEWASSIALIKSSVAKLAELSVKEYHFGNYRDAFKFAYLSKDKKDAGALRVLGNCYFYGVGTQRDYDKAFAAFQPLSDMGVFSGEQGDCYWYGYGTDKDEGLAVSLYIAGASMQDPHCLYRLGYCYYTGEGGTKNVEEGLAYINKAARMKEPNAIEFLNKLKTNQ